MANNENLLKGNPPTEFKTGREQVETAKEGGIESGKAKRKTKSYKELFDTLQNKPVSKDQTIDIYKEDTDGDMKLVKISLVDFVRNKFPDIPENEIDNAIFAATKMVDLINHPKAEVAMKAFEIIRDTSGQKPTDNLNINPDDFDLRDTQVLVESEVKAMSYEEIKSLIENKHLKKYVVLSDKDMKEEAKRMKKEFKDG